MVKSKGSMTNRAMKLDLIDNSLEQMGTTRNFDNSTREYDPQGLKKWQRGEWPRSRAAIIEYIRASRPKQGDLFYVAAETLPNGGACSYTVEMVGEHIYDFRVVGRIRIV